MFLGERLIDPSTGRTMDSPVCHRGAPVIEFGGEFMEVGELGAEEEVLTYVAEHPLDLVQRFPRTLLDEHFRVEGRRTWFETIEEMQGALDTFLVTYNRRCPYQGRGMKGCIPW